VSHIYLSFLGATKAPPIVTPLMEYVRQKRAVDSGPLVNYSGTSDYFLFSHVYVLPEVRNS
jgi:hypothetical protein